MGRQDDTASTCAAYRVTENGQTRYFTTSPGEELLDAARMLRRYCTSTEHSTGKFISLYLQAQLLNIMEHLICSYTLFLALFCFYQIIP